jgi:hypothetical protein
LPRVEHPREGNIASQIWAKATHAVSGPTVRPIAFDGHPISSAGRAIGILMGDAQQRHLRRNNYPVDGERVRLSETRTR